MVVPLHSRCDGSDTKDVVQVTNYDWKRNINRTTVDEEHDEIAGEMRPRRQAAKNADIMKLQDV